jgi:predicted aspartyl protease
MGQQAIELESRYPMHRSVSARFLVGFLILAWLATGPARAQTCPPLQLLNQIRMASVNDGTRMLVPVTINGADKFMILDTGSPASSVSRALAEELGLPVSRKGGALYDVNGNVSHEVATVAHFKFGQQEVRGVQFRIWPNPDLGKVDPRLAGVIARDQLFQYDLDVDFANGVLKLFSPEHCEGKILYWKAAAVAVEEFDTKDGHINIAATLDGQKVDGIIDSGAINSILRADVARELFGLTAGSPGMSQSAMLTVDPQYPVYQHQFAKLEFNGVTVSDPVIAVWPSIAGRDADRSYQSTGNRAMPRNVHSNVSRLVIGMDVLKKLHVYFAFREGHMYVSEAPANAPSSK